MKLPNYLNKVVVALLVCFSFFLLNSCSTLGQEFSEEKELKSNVAFTKNYTLLPIEDSPEEIKSDVILKIKYLGKEINVLLHLSVNNERIIAESVSPHEYSGKFEYSGKKIHTNINLSKEIKPEDLVAYFQWCFYDIGQVASSIEECDLHFTVERNSKNQSEIRRIYNDEKCLIEITKTTNEVLVTQYSKKYSCKINFIR